MFANYQWDNTYNNWVGTYKFEHALVPGTSLVNSTYYGWNTSTDNWYVSSKDIYNTGTDINGVNITQTISTANPATYVLLQSSKNIYTKPFKTNVQDLENFILTEGFVWDNTSKTWVNNDKTTREFNSKGLINQSVQQKWVKDATTSVYGWVDASKHLYTYDVFGNRASEILQEKDTATSEWKNISLTEFMYDITSENTGFIQYENDGTGNWKFISRTEHDEDQTGKLLKDMYVYYNENLNKNIINKWEENVYNSAGQLIKHIHDFSTVITWNAATQKFSFSTEGKQEEFSYNNAGKVLNETSSIYDSENERFVYSTKSAYQYHETYPTAITEEITSIWNTSANQWINNSKTDLTYNFSYPQNSLVLPAIIKNNTDGILKYYAYLLQNSVTQVWNATTQTWMNDEKNIMYFTSKTVSEIKPAFSSDINIYPNPTRNFVQINFASTTVRLSLFDLQGRIILQQELTSADNRIDLSGLDAGVYLYEIRNAEGEKQKGKLMIE
jgi:hypothetical protein